MGEPIEIDRAWLADHPLPRHPEDTDKNGRGRVLAVGGSRTVPEGVRLTGEAALRAGAGKVRFATVQSLAIPLGIAVPEAGVISLPEDGQGEIDASAASSVIAKAVSRCDCVVLGPAMTSKRAGADILSTLLSEPRPGLSMVFDAAAIAATAKERAAVERHEGRVVITPNPGEVASLLGREIDDINRDPVSAARKAVELTGAVVILKGPRSVVATPRGEFLSYPGGGIGLATGGSGDVLAGILGGLLARGLSPLASCAWAVWIHGEAGRSLARSVGPVGYLARELVVLIPALMAKSH